MNNTILEQHLSWLRVYAEGMSEKNWRDMKALIERQLDRIDRDLKSAAPL